MSAEEIADSSSLLATSDITTTTTNALLATNTPSTTINDPNSGGQMNDLSPFSVQAIALSQDEQDVVNVTKEYPFEIATIILGYMMPFLLILTLITNTLVVMVLAQRHMRTPTNIVLSTMAIVDLLTVLTPSPWYFYIYTLGYDKFLYPPIVCYAHHMMTDVIPVFLHTSSIWLALLLAGQRYIYVCHPTLASTWCTVPRVKRAIVIILVIAFLHQLTKFFDNTFVAVQIQIESSNHSACRNEISNWVQELNPDIYYTTYYTFRIVFVFILPCVALITLNCLLFRALRRAEDKRTELLRTKFKLIGGNHCSVGNIEAAKQSSFIATEGASQQANKAGPSNAIAATGSIAPSALSRSRKDSAFEQLVGCEESDTTDHHGPKMTKMSLKDGLLDKRRKFSIASFQIGKRRNTNGACCVINKSQSNLIKVSSPVNQTTSDTKLSCSTTFDNSGVGGDGKRLMSEGTSHQQRSDTDDLVVSVKRENIGNDQSRIISASATGARTKLLRSRESNDSNDNSLQSAGRLAQTSYIIHSKSNTTVHQEEQLEDKAVGQSKERRRRVSLENGVCEFEKAEEEEGEIRSDDEEKEDEDEDEEDEVGENDEDDDFTCAECAACEKNEGSLECQHCSAAAAMSEERNAARHHHSSHQTSSQCSSLAGGATNNTNEDGFSCLATQNASSSMFVAMHDGTLDTTEATSMKEELAEDDNIREAEKQTMGRLQDKSHGNHNNKSIASDRQQSETAYMRSSFGHVNSIAQNSILNDSNSSNGGKNKRSNSVRSTMGQSNTRMLSANVQTGEDIHILPKSGSVDSRLICGCLVMADAQTKGATTTTTITRRMPLRRLKTSPPRRKSKNSNHHPECRECCLENDCNDEEAAAGSVQQFTSADLSTGGRSQTGIRGSAVLSTTSLRRRDSDNKNYHYPSSVVAKKKVIAANCVTSCSSSDPCINCNRTSNRKLVSRCSITDGDDIERRGGRDGLPTSQSDYGANGDKMSVREKNKRIVASSGYREHGEVNGSCMDGIRKGAIATTTTTTTTTTTLYSTNTNSIGSLLQVHQNARDSIHREGSQTFGGSNFSRITQTKNPSFASPIGASCNATTATASTVAGRAGRATSMGGSNHHQPGQLIVTGNLATASLRTMDSSRTTLMLIVVVTVFLIVEVPAAIVTILHLLRNTFRDLFRDVEFGVSLSGVGLFTNFFVTISYSVNFTIYCSMSKKFRETFRDLFMCGKRAKRKHVHRLPYQQQQHSKYHITTQCFNNNQDNTIPVINHQRQPTSSNIVINNNTNNNADTINDVINTAAIECTQNEFPLSVSQHQHHNTSTTGISASSAMKFSTFRKAGNQRECEL